MFYLFIYFISRINLLLYCVLKTKNKNMNTLHHHSYILVNILIINEFFKKIKTFLVPR
jgi:hypothetical protein